MHALRQRLLLRHSLPWLLCLAMLLPMAQLAAAWHGVSHASASQSGPSDDRQAPHAQHCDLCLTAAGVVGGALPSHAPAVALASTEEAAPRLAAMGAWLSPIALAYLSRAPPGLRIDR
jgi:hypothetical protein